MKTKLLIITLLCFSLLTASSAQEPNAEPTVEELQQQFADVLRNRQSPRAQLRREAGLASSAHAQWNGSPYNLLRNMLIRGEHAELGLTQDQEQRLQFLRMGDPMRIWWSPQMRENPTPEFLQVVESIREISQAAASRGDVNFELATEEQKDAYTQEKRRNRGAGHKICNAHEGTFDECVDR